MRALSLAAHPTGRWQRLAYIVISGIVAGFCITFPTAVGAILEWGAYIPAALVLFSLVKDEKVRYGRVWGAGLLFFMSQYLVIYHWFFSFYPLDFTGMSRPYAAVVVGVAWIGLSLLASLAGSVAVLLLVLISRSRAAERCPIAIPFVAGALYAVFEWSQTIGWTGVPWGRLALGQIPGNFTAGVMTSSLFGPYFISFLIVSVAFLLAGALYLGKPRLRVILALSLVGANLLCGCALAYIPVAPTSELNVAAVQGNIPSRDKWDSSTYAETLWRYSEYTHSAAESGAQLVIWPETTLPYSVEPDDARHKMLVSLAASCDVTLVVGCFDKTYDGQMRNVLISINPDGTSGGTYAKRHLVPFGEYMPLRTLLTALIPPLAEIAMLEDDLLPGSDSAIITTGNGARLGCIICFDSIYETLPADAVSDGASIIVLSTNDSWFTDSAAVYMHNAQARLRAIENGRYVIRAANTGISSIIDRTGQTVEILPPMVEGVLITKAELYDYRTLYSIVGNLFVYLCISFICVLPAASAVLRLTVKTKKQ